MKNIGNLFGNKVLMAAVLVAGAGIGWLVKPSHHGAAEEEHQHKESSKTQVWSCAMHPQIRRDGPGKCPICHMDLTPLEAKSAADEPGLVEMPEHARKLANVQTSVVGYGKQGAQKISLQGKIEVDERRITKIPAHFHGRIEKLHVNFTGETVTKGQVMAEVYSPELMVAEEEFLQSLKYKETQPSLYRASRNKLKYWKIAESEIDEVEKSGKVSSRVKIHAHHGGVVLKRHVSLGDHVKMGDILFEVADLSRLWALFDAYEKDLGSIKKGMKIQFTTPSLPGNTFKSVVSFVDPVIDPITRVSQVRAEIDNAPGRLKPQMFVRGSVVPSGDGKQEALLVPRSAVLWTGKRSVVYVERDDFEPTAFEYRRIILGPEAGDFYVVDSGLSEGDRVVTNGAFTIDAAAQLGGKISMMNPSSGEDNEGKTMKMPSGHQH